MKEKRDKKLEKMNKKTFWERISEDNLYFMAYEMGYTKSEVDKSQKKRLLISIIAATLPILILGTDQSYSYIASVILAVYMWKSPYSSLKRKFNEQAFKRELDFWRFIRMVIPFLASSQSLYSIFGEQLKMMNDESPGSVKTNLRRLMREMTDSPQDVEPFITFAEKCSGSDRAVLTMSAIYDKSEFSDDMSIVEELGEIATNELFKRRSMITNMKLKRLNKASYVMVFSSMLIVIAYAVGMISMLLKAM